jgi:hypothetical protein
MTLNRLIFPLSEHAMPDGMRRTALADILGADFSAFHDDALYRNLGRLHPNRERIEAALAAREKTLFNLDDTWHLYDLTSTYFEGQALRNPPAKRGYSRDKRPDGKQVVVGLVLDRDGFPKAREVLEGNRPDRTTVGEMLASLEKRTGPQPGATVVVDWGMAYEENLAAIRARGYHYWVAGRPPERKAWREEFAQEDGGEEVIREPSPRHAPQKKSQVRIQLRRQGNEVYILGRSEEREAKDRALRETHEQRLRKDLERLQARIEKGQLSKPERAAPLRPCGLSRTFTMLNPSAAATSWVMRFSPTLWWISAPRLNVRKECWLATKASAPGSKFSSPCGRSTIRSGKWPRAPANWGASDGERVSASTLARHFLRKTCSLLCSVSWCGRPARANPDFSPRVWKGGASAPPLQGPPDYCLVPRPAQLAVASCAGRGADRAWVLRFRRG